MASITADINIHINQGGTDADANVYRINIVDMIKLVGNNPKIKLDPKKEYNIKMCKKEHIEKFIQILVNSTLDEKVLRDLICHDGIIDLINEWGLMTSDIWNTIQKRRKFYEKIGNVNDDIVVKDNCIYIRTDGIMRSLTHMMSNTRCVNIRVIDNHVTMMGMDHTCTNIFYVKINTAEKKPIKKNFSFSPYWNITKNSVIKITNERVTIFDLDSMEARECAFPEFSKAFRIPPCTFSAHVKCYGSDIGNALKLSTKNRDHETYIKFIINEDNISINGNTLEKIKPTWKNTNEKKKIKIIIEQNEAVRFNFNCNIDYPIEIFFKEESPVMIRTQCNNASMIQGYTSLPLGDDDLSD